jgi:galactokinase
MSEGSDDPVQVLRSAFEAAFGGAPDVVVRSPGRVNLIGEHTDYNDGYVLPMAIQKGTLVALRLTRSSRLCARSLALPGVVDVPLGLPPTPGEDAPPWAAYVRGPLALLRRGGVSIEGAEAMLSSDLSLGAGLSSSASVEVGVARAALAAAGGALFDPDLAALIQRAEHEYAGVRCGLMDPMAVIAGREGHALFFDCRLRASEHIPLPAGTRVLVLDTQVSRSLASSAYNARRSACERAVEALKGRAPRVRALRDVDEEQLADPSLHLDDEARLRARHVVRENERVLACVDALTRGALLEVGSLFVESHKSLRDDFQVSSAALDTMVEEALREPGVFGARMTGAGFGGCAIALVAEDRAQEACKHVLERYRARTSLPGDGFVAQASAGASVLA